MLTYWQEVLGRAFELARVTLAFSVMSKRVECERDDLFYLPLDGLVSFLAANLSRQFAIRHDYRLDEYTTYVYR
jgi:hypothetical protein